MTTVNAICEFLDSFAPLGLAEDWDNVGLLVGDESDQVQRIMTCLTITPESANEAVDQNADLIVTHHPLPFRPLQRITTQHTASRLLIKLIRNRVAVYSPHTAFDSAREGINQQLTERFGLSDAQPLVAVDDVEPDIGSGRIATANEAWTLAELANRAKTLFQLSYVQIVGNPNQSCRRIALACGSGGSFLEPAIRAGCDTLITGESSFHTCLEASAQHCGLLLLGHFASERFAVERLAEVLGQQFSGVCVWASSRESDPLLWI